MIIRRELSLIVSKYWDLIFLGFFSFLTRFFNLSFPAKVIFDEAHFGLYASKYLSHQYYFDIHPPLGKMFLAFFGFLGKIKTDFYWLPGSNYPTDLNFLAFRFLPAFLGSFLVVLIYLLMKEMGFSRRVAFLSSFLILLGNAFIVQSRFILLDIILLFFIILSIYFFFFSKRFSFPSFKWYFLNLCCALSLAVAISVKWTGFGVLGMIWIFTIFEERIFSKSKKEIISRISLIFVLPFLIYFLIFFLHFSLLSLTCIEHCGEVIDKHLDIINIVNPENLSSIPFSNLNNSPDGNLFQKFIEENKAKLGSNLGDSLSHYYASDWWTWPFMLRPILYFQESEADKVSSIYFFGNPLVWWLGLFGVLGYFYLIIKNFFYKFKLKLSPNFYSYSSYFLISSYLIYLLPFCTISRFMLIYHYLPALTFSLILFAVVFEGLIELIFGPSLKDKILFKDKKANILLFLLLVAVFLSFLYFSPFTYGIPLTEQQLQSRFWLFTWGL